MAILNRLARLFRADFHAVIDQLEEPYMLLKQSVREMEASLQQDRSRLKQQQNQKRVLDERCDELASAIAGIEEELEVCFDADNDALARVLIKRKLETQQLLKSFNAKHAALNHEIDQLTARIEEHAPRLDSMKQKLELLSDEVSEASTELVGTSLAGCVRDADVEVALLRAKQQRSQA